MLLRSLKGWKVNHTRLWQHRVGYKLPVGTETRTAPRPTTDEILSQRPNGKTGHIPYHFQREGVGVFACKKEKDY